MAVKFVVYDIRSYFWQQPKGLKCCPVCGKSISSVEIPPSRAVASELELWKGNVPVHYFSYLYECSACHWWAVRESWGIREGSSELDFLVVGMSASKGGDDQQPVSWRQILQDESLYSRAEPLPENLGQLFIGGQAKR